MVVIECVILHGSFLHTKKAEKERDLMELRVNSYLSDITLGIGWEKTMYTQGKLTSIV